MAHKVKRTGIYVYCSAEEKKRIKEAARKQRRSLSDYAVLAILKQVEHDEQVNTRKG
jgi:uncharacterized protein (DUF1778 family)